MSVYREGSSWWVDIAFNHRRYRKRSPDASRGGALAYEALLRREAAKHGSMKAAIEALDPQLGPDAVHAPTFAEFAERWMRDYVDVNNKPSEQYTKRIVLRSRLIPRFGRVRLDALSTVEIERFKAELLASRLSPKTANNYLAILRTCLSTAVDWSVIATSPKFKLLRAVRPGFRYLEHVELERLVDAANGTIWRDMIVTAARTGLRLSELIALEWQDIDFGRRLLTVQRASVRGVVGTPKNNRTRHLPIGADVIEALEPRRCPAGLVFNRDGRPVSRESARCNLRAICRLAGASPHGWHVLRHTFASHLAEIGTPLQVIMELLGHSSIAMVLRYAHLCATPLTSAVAALDAHTTRLRQPDASRAIRDRKPGHPPVANEATFFAEETEKHHAAA